MVDYMEAIKLPFTNFKKLSIGALLWMVPIINIVTGMFAMGYVLNVSKAAMKKKFILPEWDNWSELFVKGLLAMVITMIWSIPVIIGLILFILSIGTAFFAAAIQNDISAMMNLISASIGSFLVLVLLAILIFYISPAAVLNYINTSNFSAAFDFKTVFSKAFRLSWLASMLFVFVWDIVLSIALMILTLVTSITVVLPIALQGYFTFVTMATMYTILGETFGEK